jgi:hypothetical protein
MVQVIPYSDLATANLIVDAVYEGGSLKNVSDDPISRLLKGTGNQGGFRAGGQGEQSRFVVLYTSGEDIDWPDFLNTENGQFDYYGDNKTPGHELHDTRRGGNRLLRYVFGLLHGSPPHRSNIPPFFIFQKSPTTNSARAVQFKGLAVPGVQGLPATADLVAIWKTSRGERFQNYRATFTVLDVPVVERTWINDLTKNIPSANAPSAWTEWIAHGRYKALISKSTTVIRSHEQQTPNNPKTTAILEAVWTYFKAAPHAFEAFAARIFQMHDPRVIVDQLTRASVDGGRDAIGRYLLGLIDDPVYAEFSLEAKCYSPPINGGIANAVGVKEVSRLISRIRHREFGVLVTTSVIGRQAYEEVRRDRHPIIFFSGKDIAEILIKSGLNTPELVNSFLEAEFPMGAPDAP